jgi:hypothetical protein
LGKADSALQSETDPNVPAWAKAANKPAYTPSEVGAEPAFAKNTAFNKNFGLTGGDVLDSGSLFGYLQLPAAFLTYLQQYGFNNIPDEAQNMFDPLMTNKGYIYVTNTGPTIPNWPNGIDYGVVRFSRRSNGELLIELFSLPGSMNGHIMYLGAWEKPRSGTGDASLRRWCGWKRVITDIDANTWKEIPVTLGPGITTLPADPIRFVYNPLLRKIRVRLSGVAAAEFNIPTILFQFSWPADLPQATKYPLRTTVGIDINGGVSIVGRSIAGVDLGVNYLSVFPYDANQETGPYPAWNNSMVFSDMTWDII